MATRYQLGPCPACSTADATVIVDADGIRDQLEQLWTFHTRRLHGATPAARLQDRLAFSLRPPLQVVRCSACTLLYRNPREQEDTVVEAYANERPGHDALRTLLDNQQPGYATQARRLTRAFGRTGRGLEVGSYVGAFLAAARDEGWSFTGLDVNEHVNAFARQQGFDAVLAHSNLLGFPYRHGFSPRSLHLLLSRSGFGRTTCRGDALVPIADEWTRRWAAAEEQAAKLLLRAAPAAASPWIEVYATAS